MNLRPLPFLLCAGSTTLVQAQFPPPAGQPGTTAMHADSSAFVAWASTCMVQRGPMDITAPGAGDASYGLPSDATGAPDGAVVSLGDAGSALLTFAQPITNGPGWDFAVFENGLNDTFLELAFVEVSNDAIDFFRFPATSNTQTDTQVGPFGTLDATQVDNLAGKYRAMYGTPFDLEQLAEEPGLDVDAILYVRVVDAVGCIQDSYAVQDHLGQKINDPWSTAFASGGFDLDAVGVIHNGSTSIAHSTAACWQAMIFPNPAQGQGKLRFTTGTAGTVRILLHDATGRVVRTFSDGPRTSGTQEQALDLNDLAAGAYFVTLGTDSGRIALPLIVE